MPEISLDREALLIVAGGDQELDPAAVLAQAATLAHLVQRLPPRLAVVMGNSAQLDALRRLAGVAGVFPAEVSAELLASLNPTEQIFASAWAARQAPKTSRPGEGAAWDAEGFEPP